MNYKWQKLGRIVSPDKNIDWMSTWTGASFASNIMGTSLFEIFIAGRDNKNRSKIGKIIVDIENPLKIIDTKKNPVLDFGEIGAFDENGVSYPWLFNWNDISYMFYVGWRPTVLTPFTLGLGLAKETEKGDYNRVSRAPILPLNNEDYLSIGSVCTFTEEDKIRLYYTSFLQWGREPGEHKHYYVIKYAESIDGINWKRFNKICIDISNEEEFSICRPSVIKIDKVYHMWFSYRGSKYRIGYASSEDGVNWLRDDSKSGIHTSKTGWDSESICYAHVFNYNGDYFMIYNGNNYGKEGLGIAKLY